MRRSRRLKDPLRLPPHPRTLLAHNRRAFDQPLQGRQSITLARSVDDDHFVIHQRTVLHVSEGDLRADHAEQQIVGCDRTTVS